MATYILTITTYNNNSVIYINTHTHTHIDTDKQYLQYFETVQELAEQIRIRQLRLHQAQVLDDEPELFGEQLSAQGVLAVVREQIDQVGHEIALHV